MGYTDEPRIWAEWSFPIDFCKRDGWDGQTKRFLRSHQ